VKEEKRMNDEDGQWIEETKYHGFTQLSADLRTQVYYTGRAVKQLRNSQ
jgi:hypothetical protein